MYHSTKSGYPFIVTRTKETPKQSHHTLMPLISTSRGRNKCLNQYGLLLGQWSNSTKGVWEDFLTRFQFFSNILDFLITKMILSMLYLYEKSPTWVGWFQIWLCISIWPVCFVTMRKSITPTKLLDEMPFNGVFYDSQTYNIIFECLIKNKKVKETWNFFLDSLRRNNL